MDDLVSLNQEVLDMGVEDAEALLDVEELERRLEMAVALPNADCWINVCGLNKG